MLSTGIMEVDDVILNPNSKEYNWKLIFMVATITLYPIAKFFPIHIPTQAVSAAAYT